MSDPYADIADPAPHTSAAPAPVPVAAAALAPIPGSRVAPIGAQDPYAEIAQREIGPMQDLAASTGTGLAQGVAGVAGGIGDIENAWGNGVDALGIHTVAALEKLTGNHHLFGAADLTAPGAASMAPFNYAHDNGLGTSADANHLIQNVVGPYHEPQTTAGRYAQSIASFVPGMALGPENAGLKLLGAAVPGIASEAAGEATQGTPYEPWARAGAAFGAGHLAGLPFGPSGADKALNAATKGMTADQIASAQALRQAGQGLGVTPTLAEASQAVTGNNAPLLARLQQLVESAPASGLNARLNGRLQASRDAVANALDQISPATNQPSLLGPRAQSAAQGALDNLAAERTALVRPAYTAAGKVTVDPDAMNGLMSSLDQRIASDGTGVLSKPLGQVRDMLTDTDAAQAAQGTGTAPLSVRDQLERDWTQLTGQSPAGTSAASASAGRVPLLDIENLDRARKFIRDNADAQLGRGALTPEQSAAMTGVADHLDRLMEVASPDYVGGKANYAQFTADNIDPIQAGPVGKIAATGQLPGQTRALFPSAPFPGQAAETGTAVRSLDEQDSGLAAALVRAHLGQAADEAMQDTRAGPNLYGPAQFAAGVAGNAGQRDALMTGLREAAGQDTAGHLGDLLDVLSATGRRLPATPADDAPLAALRPAAGVDPLEAGIGFGVGKEAFGSGGLVMPLISRAVGAGADALNRLRVNSNAADLADALTSHADATSRVIMDARAKQDQGRAILAQVLANTLTAPRTATQGSPAQ